MRLFFFGTPGFAVPALQALAGSRHEVAAVISQPDRPRGRSKTPLPCECKVAAGDLGLPDPICPEKLTSKDFAPFVKNLSPDAAVVAAYGKIFRPWIFELFPKGLINIHPSLLPRHRGPAPVSGAIFAGDLETGVTIIKLDSGMDTGDILLQITEPVEENETAGELEERLSRLAPPLLLQALESIEEGRITPTPQDPEQATVTRLLSKEDGRIDWTRPAREIHNRVRGCNPWPGARTSFREKPLLLWKTAVRDSGPAQEPGGIIETGKNLLVVAAQTGSLELLEIQRPGRARLTARDFLNGTRPALGERFS